MKNIISLCTVLMMFLAFTANANNDPKNDPDKPVVTQRASFKGGQAELANYLKKNLEYPILARENALEGDVTISFFIQADGSIHGAQIVDGFNSLCDAAALDVIKNMPKWAPATRNGRAVPSKYKLTVNYSLDF